MKDTPCPSSSTARAKIPLLFALSAHPARRKADPRTRMVHRTPFCRRKSEHNPERQEPERHLAVSLRQGGSRLRFAVERRAPGCSLPSKLRTGSPGGAHRASLQDICRIRVVLIQRVGGLVRHLLAAKAPDPEGVDDCPPATSGRTRSAGISTVFCISPLWRPEERSASGPVSRVGKPGTAQGKESVQALSPPRGSEAEFSPWTPMHHFGVRRSRRGSPSP